MATPTIIEPHPELAGRSVPGDCWLVASELGDGVGYATAAGVAVAGKIPIKLDVNGNLVRRGTDDDGDPLVLRPNLDVGETGSIDAIDYPRGTRWAIDLKFPGMTVTPRLIKVPDTAGTYHVEDILNDTLTPIGTPMSATGVVFTPTGSITATNVQEAIQQAASLVSGISFVEIPFSSSTVWLGTHALGYRPNVLTTDSARSEIKGDVTFPSLTQVRVQFGSARAGYMQLS